MHAIITESLDAADAQATSVTGGAWSDSSGRPDDDERRRMRGSTCDARQPVHLGAAHGRPDEVHGAAMRA